MAFHIPHYIFQWLIMAADYHVSVAWHDIPGIDIKSFLLLTMLPTFYQLILLLVSYKNVYPVNCGKLMKYALLLSQNL
jgi:hypothetical protein